MGLYFKRGEGEDNDYFISKKDVGQRTPMSDQAFTTTLHFPLSQEAKFTKASWVLSRAFLMLFSFATSALESRDSSSSETFALFEAGVGTFNSRVFLSNLTIFHLPAELKVMVKAGYCLLAHSSDDPCKLEGCLVKIKLRKCDSHTSVVQAHVVQSGALHAGLPGDSDAYHIAPHALLTFATIDGLGLHPGWHQKIRILLSQLLDLNNDTKSLLCISHFLLPLLLCLFLHKSLLVLLLLPGGLSCLKKAADELAGSGSKPKKCQKVAAAWDRFLYPDFEFRHGTCFDSGSKHVTQTCASLALNFSSHMHHWAQSGFNHHVYESTLTILWGYQQQNVSFFVSQSMHFIHTLLAASLLGQEVFWICKPQTPNSLAIHSQCKDIPAVFTSNLASAATSH